MKKPSTAAGQQPDPTSVLEASSVPDTPQPEPALADDGVADDGLAEEAVAGQDVDISAPEWPESAGSLPRKPFPIIGIGASAGGLEALEQFFKTVPQHPGMAFVIVQHLDPTRTGLMPELLQHGTTLRVEQVLDRVRVRPDHIYVIPPNKDLSLLHGVLHLFDPTAVRGLRLPINFFFRSLAEDQRQQAIGIILSGMGSDGTLGLRAIKEAGGITLVQDPTSAKFDGMPRSAIEAGLGDIVASTDGLFERLHAYLYSEPRAVPALPLTEERDQSGLDKVVILLRTHTGHDFSLYKKPSLYRRIERRMALNKVDKIAQYVRFLQENPSELELLFRELLIGVTSFFRDPEAWGLLRDQVLPALLAQRPAGGTLRAWVAGCSTGEEAYSLGIVFREALERLWPNQAYALQIFATDLDPDAIVHARQGFYTEKITADVSTERLRRFFTREEGGGYRIGREIRSMTIFASQDLIQDPPFTKIDILICRNLLIYMTAALQRKLMVLFHYSLNPGGVLFLGSAETVSSTAEMFAILDGKWRIYQREIPNSQVKPMTLPLTPPPALVDLPPVPPTPPTISLQTQFEPVLLQRFSPAGVLAHPHGDILSISGRTGKYLEPPSGRVNWNIFAMAREGLREVLLTLVQQALHGPAGEPVVQRALRVRTNGDFQCIDLSIQALREPPALRGMLLLVFQDLPMPKRRGRRRGASLTGEQVELLAQEAEQLREALVATREAMQTSQEELKSTNEELQSTNEELQSANEELLTSKEEMQSLNEELQTVNAELQTKVDNLSEVNDDMKNLLDSTELATLFLDASLHVRRFTTQAAKLIKLIPTDLGRPVTDIASDLFYPELTEDVAEVLRTLVFIEKPISARNGRWFTIRIMPYRTLDNRIDGVVITLVEVTRAKTLEDELRQVQEELARLRAGATAVVTPPPPR